MQSLHAGIACRHGIGQHLFARAGIDEDRHSFLSQPIGDRAIALRRPSFRAPSGAGMNQGEGGFLLQKRVAPGLRCGIHRQTRSANLQRVRGNRRRQFTGAVDHVLRLRCDRLRIQPTGLSLTRISVSDPALATGEARDDRRANRPLQVEHRIVFAFAQIRTQVRNRTRRCLADSIFAPLACIRFHNAINDRAEFDKQTVEGRRQISSSLLLDYKQGKSILNERNLVTGQKKRLESSIPDCLTDLLTGVFYAASQPMEIGKDFYLPVADPLRTVLVTMKVESREVVKTQAGTFKTIRVQPTADAGVVKNRGDIWIWYTDDARHLPVQMRARLFWGTITFRLVSVEGK